MHRHLRQGAGSAVPSKFLDNPKIEGRICKNWARIFLKRHRYVGKFFCPPSPIRDGLISFCFPVTRPFSVVFNIGKVGDNVPLYLPKNLLAGSLKKMYRNFKRLSRRLDNSLLEV